MIKVNRREAFTLIELLIVVAIIAILAAIAVPNFLEAQTRAKVSRTKSDMRAVGLAMHAYTVDNGFIPLPSNATYGISSYFKWDDYTGRVHGELACYLTSPVAYMTDIPWDVFNSNVWKRLRPHDGNYDVRNASVFMRSAGKSRLGITYMYWPTKEADAEGIQNYWDLPTCLWIVSSAGPDIIPWPMTSIARFPDVRVYLNMEYDPTNGTVSYGDIYMTDVAGIRGGGGY